MLSGRGSPCSKLWSSPGLQTATHLKVSLLATRPGPENREQRNGSQQLPDLGDSMAPSNRGTASQTQGLSSPCLEHLVPSSLMLSVLWFPLHNAAGDRLAPSSLPQRYVCRELPCVLEAPRRFCCSPGRALKELRKADGLRPFV